MDHLFCENDAGFLENNRNREKLIRSRKWIFRFQKAFQVINFHVDSSAANVKVGIGDQRKFAIKKKETRHRKCSDEPMLDVCQLAIWVCPPFHMNEAIRTYRVCFHLTVELC